MHFNVAPERIERRARFLAETGQIHASKPIFTSVGIQFDPAVATVLSEAYYLLSESYKSYRNEPRHYTELPKVAALTCAAVCAVAPLQVPEPNFSILTVRFANAMFAMRLACSAIEHPWHMRAFEERRRTYDDLAVTYFPCLDNFLKDVRAGKKKDLSLYNAKTDKFDIGLTLSQSTKIESFVSRFVVYQQQKIYAAFNNLASRFVGPRGR